jgi:hypothetical protein
MKYLSLLFILCIITVTLTSCFSTGSRESVWRPLYFERRVNSDTADFIRDHLDNHPFSVELLGKPLSITNSGYSLFLQIGIYGSPDFDSSLLKLNPEKVYVKANDLKAMGKVANGSVADINPWKARSSHVFVFHKDSLLERLGDKAIVQLLIAFNDYAVYDNVPVEIEPIKALDPWFRDMVLDTAVNSTSESSESQ